MMSSGRAGPEDDEDGYDQAVTLLATPPSEALLREDESITAKKVLPVPPIAGPALAARAGGPLATPPRFPAVGSETAGVTLKSATSPPVIKPDAASAAFVATLVSAERPPDLLIPIMPVDHGQSHTEVMPTAPVKLVGASGALPPSPNQGRGSPMASPSAFHEGHAPPPQPQGGPAHVGKPPAFPPPAYAMTPAASPTKGPPYAIVVAVAAALSIVIPLLLFLILRGAGSGDATPSTARPAPDPVSRTEPSRKRSGKATAPAVSSVTAPAKP